LARTPQPGTQARRTSQPGDQSPWVAWARFSTGIAIFEAPDEETPRRIVADEPVTGGGHTRGDLRPYRLGLLRGRDR
jgi:hypothetical protein